ncbi:matrix metalloproteinase-18-like [Hemicordylus capensis]|uniref:matrix metalloproteinase-18-like n=1 Tax=Hemicordylus capensis TaxID=884348 RepID=UPI00230282D7|nr:matrix metalloproteinase-18-like [Hemicordylus capensis]
MESILFCAALFLSHSFAVPVDPRHTAQQVLQGYLDKFYPSVLKGGPHLEEQIREMQKFFHLTVTGTLTKETEEVMNQPRCGVPDVAGASQSAPRWGRNVLTYRINRYTRDLPSQTVDRIIKQAFQVWSDVTPLVFRKTSRPADIEISFAYGAHGDSSAFDGRGGILAHAFPPGQGTGGDAHFDESERWSEYNREVNLFLVAAHEFGHSLGLQHSSVRGALMYPSYSYQNPQRFKLSNDDTQKIQRLYGKKK